MQSGVLLLADCFFRKYAFRRGKTFDFMFALCLNVVVVVKNVSFEAPIGLKCCIFTQMLKSAISMVALQVTL